MIPISFESIASLKPLFADPKSQEQQLLKKYADHRSRFVSINGSMIHYREEGTGQPLILLHGAFSSLHTFEGWVKLLAKKYRVISIDLPGFGLTGAISEDDYCFENYMTYLNIFLDRLEIEKCYLAGNSLGGWIAWEYALRHQEQIEKLVLISSAGFVDEASIPTPFKLAKLPVFGKIFKYALQRPIFEKFVREVYCEQSVVCEETIDRYFDFFTRDCNMEAFFNIINQELHDNTEKLKNLYTPTLIIWGKEDAWLPAENARRFSELLPNNRMLIYSDVGHIPMEEKPKKTANAVSKFLKEDF
ncbi:alpha/beta fold hydrolase [Bernardetia sp.]|uniref:alpha/beta fold hydrolase n=1 Tax=Bernardetia sp. TaxID=1937974 RepID=UPI0025C47070|nr:alpha/beta hydrolase [Bernardetia sp.]